MNNQLDQKPMPLRTYAADLEHARNNGESNATAPENTPAHPETAKSTSTAKETSSAKETLRTDFTVPKPIPKVPPTPAPDPKPVPKKPTLPPIPKVDSVKSKPAPTKDVKPVPKAQPPKKVPTSIPAFHEIQKQKQSTPGATLGSGDYDTTIIRETKKSSRNPFKKLAATISGWFKAITRRKKKTAVHKASEKTAAKKTTTTKPTAATSDTLRDRIQTHKEVNEPEVEPDTHWSPQTETGYNLLEAPEAESPTTSIKNVSLERKQFSVTTPNIPPVEPVSPQSATIPADTPATPPEVINPEPPVESPVPEEVAPAQPPLESNVALKTVPPNTPPVTPTKPPRSSHEMGRFQRLQSTDTNTLTLQIMGGLVSVFAVAVAGVLLFNVFTNTDTVVETSTTYEPIITSANLTPVTLTAADIDALPKLIASTTAQTPSGVTEYIIVGQDEVAVSPSYLFSLLSFDTMPSLRQAISQAHLVTVNSNRPSLLLKHTDSEAVYGGLLNWEQTMADDLRALYAMPSTIPASFTDQRINGVDTRVLAVEGNTIIIYAFLDDTTVLITPSRADFTQIQDLYNRE